MSYASHIAGATRMFRRTHTARELHVCCLAGRRVHPSAAATIIRISAAATAVCPSWCALTLISLALSMCAMTHEHVYQAANMIGGVVYYVNLLSPGSRTGLTVFCDRAMCELLCPMNHSTGHVARFSNANEHGVVVPFSFLECWTPTPETVISQLLRQARKTFLFSQHVQVGARDYSPVHKRWLHFMVRLTSSCGGH